ncbi:MAG TPA: Uma2 family endonuclease [Burkholderiales bacterium]|nr:Uma2 family endonuclease [Burkholderiales bacterium]
MGTPQKAVAWIKPEEYLALEEKATTKHEYLDGVVYAWQGFAPDAMAGGSRAHSQVIQNLVVTLRPKLRGTPCRTYAADIRLHVRQRQAYFYPDVAVTCSPSDSPAAQADAAEFAEPTVIFEVLSDSTEAFDRGEKFEAYKQIPTLEEYLLVSPAGRRVEAFRRGQNSARETCEATTPVRVEALATLLQPEEIFEGLI